MRITTGLPASTGSRVISWIAFQTLINLGGITRSIPLTGIPLPFVSYGGSALIAMMAGIGILLSVSRYGKDKTYAERPPARRARSRHLVSRPSGGRGVVPLPARPTPAHETRTSAP